MRFKIDKIPRMSDDFRYFLEPTDWSIYLVASIVHSGQNASFAFKFWTYFRCPLHNHFTWRTGTHWKVSKDLPFQFHVSELYTSKMYDSRHERLAMCDAKTVHGFCGTTLNWNELSGGVYTLYIIELNFLEFLFTRPASLLEERLFQISASIHSNNMIITILSSQRTLSVTSIINPTSEWLSIFVNSVRSIHVPEYCYRNATISRYLIGSHTNNSLLNHCKRNVVAQLLIHSMPYQFLKESWSQT